VALQLHGSQRIIAPPVSGATIQSQKKHISLATFRQNGTSFWHWLLYLSKELGEKMDSNSSQTIIGLVNMGMKLLIINDLKDEQTHVDDSVFFFLTIMYVFLG